MNFLQVSPAEAQILVEQSSQKEEIISSLESNNISEANRINFGDNSKSGVIILKTACEEDAGTNSNIQAKLGSLANQDGYTTNWVTLNNPGNDRTRCAEDYYKVTFSDAISGVRKLKLRTDSAGLAPSWKLAWVEVAIPGQKQRTSWNIWLGGKKQKGQWSEYILDVPF